MSPVVKRVYQDALDSKAKSIAHVAQQVYPEMKPVKISADQLRVSLERQVALELSRREDHRSTLAAKLHPIPQKHTLPASEVEGVVKRVFYDAISSKAAKLKALEDKRRGPKDDPASSTNHHSAEELAASAARLSVPRKRVLTEDEINAILFA